MDVSEVHSSAFLLVQSADVLEVHSSSFPLLVQGADVSEVQSSASRFPRSAATCTLNLWVAEFTETSVTLHKSTLRSVLVENDFEGSDSLLFRIFRQTPFCVCVCGPSAWKCGDILCFVSATQCQGAAGGVSVVVRSIWCWNVIQRSPSLAIKCDLLFGWRVSEISVEMSEWIDLFLWGLMLSQETLLPALWYQHVVLLSETESKRGVVGWGKSIADVLHCVSFLTHPIKCTHRTEITSSCFCILTNL